MRFERCISLCIVRNSIDKYTFDDTRRYARHTMQIHVDTTRSSGAQEYLTIPFEIQARYIYNTGLIQEMLFRVFLSRIENVSLAYASNT